ncbi:MAG TPA: outer membrane protein assembly factor BamA, partial [Candidatus Tenderia sp.]|nr:outer membrane protein assembly factor BamA [Candidatus Tenderia sp.]
MRFGCQSLVALLLLLAMGKATAFAPFTVEEIKVEGLQRITTGTVFNYLPIELHDRVTEQRTQQAITALYDTGFFHDIELLRDGNVLVVKVIERPSIASVTISGNDKIGGEELLDALKDLGLAKGKTFDRSLLDRIQQDMQRQYFSLGHYAVDVATEVTEVDHNRVDVHIEIKEGSIAKIQMINIVGNTVFPEDELLDQFELGVAPLFALFSSRDQYSKPKLGADLETLRSYYMDRGYINFDIESTQISITPDRQGIYVTINVIEGEQYFFSSVKLAGDLVVGEEELTALIDIAPGDVFSRRKLNAASQALTSRLGKEGYAFANVNAIPDVNKEARTVGLTFFVDPGSRTYVRRINIAGNQQTEDEVVRREMRQMEGAWLSPDKVERSRVRIQRLGYLSSVNIDTQRVPGTTDQVDVNIDVVEQPSGSLMMGIGYSDGQGMLLNASVSQNNFLGSGEKITAEINTSAVNTIYSFSHTNPYYTLNGVSRSFKAYYRETDTSRRTSVANYTTDVWGGTVNFGLPLGEYDTARVGLGYENITVNTTQYTPAAYTDFLADNGDNFGIARLTLGWSHDTRNRTIFATKGFLQTLSTDLISPTSGLEFYKIYSRTRWFAPLSETFTLSLNGEVSHGEAYGETTDLPFFEKFYAGGARSVRGYRASSLGPKDVAGRVNLGGNFRVVGNAEIVFPPPFSP